MPLIRRRSPFPFPFRRSSSPCPLASMLPSESSIGAPPLIDANEVEVALMRNDALTVRAFLDALRDTTVSQRHTKGRRRRPQQRQ